jgi:hypothetical protein
VKFRSIHLPPSSDSKNKPSKPPITTDTAYWDDLLTSLRTLTRLHRTALSVVWFNCPLPEIQFVAILFGRGKNEPIIGRLCLCCVQLPKLNVFERFLHFGSYRPHIALTLHGFAFARRVKIRGHNSRQRGRAEMNSLIYTVVPWIASNLLCECFARRAKIFNKF